MIMLFCYIRVYNLVCTRSSRDRTNEEHKRNDVECHNDDDDDGNIVVGNIQKVEKGVKQKFKKVRNFQLS